MSPRARFALYLVVLHLLFAGVAALLLRQTRLWLLLVEVVFVSSFAVGLWLTRRLLQPLGFVRDSARLLKESEFTTRFLPVGQPEIDELIGVYNGMADHLREERVRLQEQEHFLGRVLDASTSGVLILDFDGNIRLVNPSAARLLQASAAELLGRALDALASPFAEALGAIGPGESRVVALGGGRRIKIERGSFVDRGFPRGFFTLEELTEELREHERAAYAKLVRMLSHEVNNTVGASNSLLHSCLNYAGQLRPEDRGDFEEALGVVIGRTEQLSRFMKGFTDVVRLPAPNREACDLRQVVEGVVRLMRAQPESSRVTWSWSVNGPLAPVFMDRGQMERVFVNVLKNALEAMGSEGTITLRLGLQDARPFVEVEDDGPGIAPEAREHLFTPFFSTKTQGQGLGLTLVQEVLAQHRFEYSLEGPPGGPTRFRVVFP